MPSTREGPMARSCANAAARAPVACRSTLSHGDSALTTAQLAYIDRSTVPLTTHKHQTEDARAAWRINGEPHVSLWAAHFRWPFGGESAQRSTIAWWATRMARRNRRQPPTPTPIQDDPVLVSECATKWYAG